MRDLASVKVGCEEPSFPGWVFWGRRAGGLRWCGWSSFWSKRRSGTFGRSNVSMSSGEYEAVVFEVYVEVVLDEEAILVEDAEKEAGSSVVVDA